MSKNDIFINKGHIFQQMDAVYVETCVYRECFELRQGEGTSGHFGQEAKDLITDILHGKYMLITSDHLEYQLKQFPEYYSLTQELDTKKLRKHIQKTNEDIQWAQSEESHGYIDFEDALHLALAFKAKARFFVTQNIRDFEDYRDKIIVITPALIGFPCFQ